jgi:hypothetical protein
MKTIPALFIALALILQSGCSSTPNQAAYKTLAAVGLTVDRAITSAADAKVAGQITDTEWAAISSKHADFRVAYNSAVSAAGMDYTSFSPELVMKLQNELLTLIGHFSK